MAPVVRRSTAANPGATRKSLRNSSLSPTPRREPPKKKLSTLKKAKQVASNIEKEEVDEIAVNDSEKVVADNHDEENDEEDDDDAPLIRHKDVILKKKAKGTATGSNAGSESVSQRRSKRGGASTPVPAAAVTGTTRKGKRTKRTSTGDDSVVMDGETDTATGSKSHFDSKIKRKSSGATKPTLKAAGDDPLEGSMSSSVSSMSVSTRKQPPSMQRRVTRRSSTPISNAITSSLELPPPHEPVECTTKYLEKEEMEGANNRKENDEQDNQIVTAASDSKVTFTQSTTITDEPPDIPPPTQPSSSPLLPITAPGTTSGESFTPNVTDCVAAEPGPKDQTASISTDSELALMIVEAIADVLPTAPPSTDTTATPTSLDLPAAKEKEDLIMEPVLTDKRGTTTKPDDSPMVTVTEAPVTSPEIIPHTAPDDNGSSKEDVMDVVTTTPNAVDTIASRDDMDVDSHDIGVGEAGETKEAKKCEVTAPIASSDISVPSSDTGVATIVPTETIDTERVSIPVAVHNSGQQNTSAVPTSGKDIEIDSKKQQETGSRDDLPVDSNVTRKITDAIETAISKAHTLPNDEHAMEVDDLVCQEDESAFDYPIPTPQMNRPSNIQSKEKPKADYKATLTIPSIAVLPASSGTKHTTIANVVPDAECKKIERMEVVHPSSREAVTEELIGNSSEPEQCEIKTSVEVDLTTASTTSSVIVLPAERDSWKTNDATAVGSNSWPDNTDSLTQSRNAQDDGSSKLRPLEMDKVDNDSVRKKRALDDGHDTTMKKMRALPGRSGHIDTIRMKRPNLTKMKLLLYTAGKLVHSKSVTNYDKLFCDYWSAFSRRLEGPMNAFELTKNRNVLHSFLKSTSLRKLHNQLILGLMERCLDTKALVADLSSTVPSHLRERMSIVTVKSSKEKRKEVENVPSTSDTNRQPPSKKFRSTDLSYTPVILGPALSIEHSTLNRAQVASTRIPGALIIDPQVRKMAESHGLNASEHAVWLINVAVKQFTMSVLEKTLSTKEAVALGHVPPLLTRHFGISDKWGAKGKYVPPTTQAFSHHTKIINSSDLHIVMANLPISSRSLSGSVSRPLYERSLGSAIGSGLDFGGPAFRKLKLHIIKMVTPTESNGPHSYASAAPPTQILHYGPAQDSLSDRSSPSVRGLGRGAKDLAALRVRASSVTSRPNNGSHASTVPVNESVGKPSDPQSPSTSVALETGNRIGGINSTMQTTNIRASPIGHRSAASKIPSLNDDVSAVPNATLDGLERVSGSSETSDSKSLSQSARRGKGFGIKNLAAMMARSVSTSSDIAADLTESANTDTAALPAADILSKTHDADLPVPTNKVTGNISKASQLVDGSAARVLSQEASVSLGVIDTTSIDALSNSNESSQPKSSNTSEKNPVNDSMTSKVEDPVVQVQGIDTTKLDATLVEPAQVNDKPLVQVKADELIDVVSLSTATTEQIPSDSNENSRQESTAPMKTDGGHLGHVSVDKVCSTSIPEATVLDKELGVATQANANAIEDKITK